MIKRSIYYRYPKLTERNQYKNDMKIIATRVLWNEDFQGPAGRVPTIAYTDQDLMGQYDWQPDLGDGSNGPGPGWGNQEAEYYIDAAITRDGSPHGSLIITASRINESNGPPGWKNRADWAYVSGKITTARRISLQYGLIEARLKPPPENGTWPALWLLGAGLLAGVPWPDCGEIDIVEIIGREPHCLLGSIHGPGYAGGSCITRKITHPAPLAADFHTYGLLWLPDLIAWFFDGVEYHRVTKSTLAGRPWVFNQQFYVIINLAMGGTLGGSLDLSVKDARLEVDYIRHLAVQIAPEGPFFGSIQKF